MPFITSLPWTRAFVLIPLTLAVGCAASGAVGNARRGAPLELSRLQIGSVYGIGSRFQSDGLEFAVDGFGEGLGNAEISTPALAAGAKREKNAAKTLRLSHATLRFQGRRSRGLEFDYIDNGGPVGLEIAGLKRIAENFIDLDAADLAQARISVTESSTAGIRRGHVRVIGTIEEFALSGAELEIAELRLLE